MYSKHSKPSNTVWTSSERKAHKFFPEKLRNVFSVYDYHRPDVIYEARRSKSHHFFLFVVAFVVVVGRIFTAGV